MYNAERLLAASEPWLQYAIRLNLFNEQKESLSGLCKQALADKKVQDFLNDLSHFHESTVSNHKNPDLPVYKLLFLLDIGMDLSVPQVKCAINAILAHVDENGVYQSRLNVPKHFGGSGEDMFGWCLCDAPSLLYALLKAGIEYEAHIRRGVDYLVSLARSRAFPCVVSSEMGKFRGPGKKDDCCPFATLIMLRLLAEIPEYQGSDIVSGCAETLLSLWEDSRNTHPYLFYMGTDFRKLKAPANWYDIVSIADTLSKVDTVRNDRRFREMISIIESRRDNDGFFTPESVYMKYAGWDFGQKKAPSPYLTYLCERILNRAG